MVANKKISMEVPIPYRETKIGNNETPAWVGGQYLIPNEEIKEPQVGLFEGPLLLDADHINQKDNKSFIEFEGLDVRRRTGAQAELMRGHGCGISSVYMAMEMIGKDEFKSKYSTVGKFAETALSMHKDDYVDDAGVRHVGTPVFNDKDGWYHDALIHTAITFGGIGGRRQEHVPSLEAVGAKLNDYLKGFRDVVAIISVRNTDWRLPTEPMSPSTHMIVINGFKFGDDGVLKSIRVCDSYVSDHARINEWMDVDERVRKSFTGRVMYFYK